MKKLTQFLASLALVGLVASSLPAAAGIIVTVGKPPDSAADTGGTKTGDVHRPTNGDAAASATPGVDATSANKPGTKAPTKSPNSVPDTGSGCTGSASSCSSPSSSGWYDPTKCHPIGGGLVYCDDPGTGGGPGAGEGGGVEDELRVTPDGTEEIGSLGCDAGGHAAPLGLALLVMAGLALRRRRSARV